MPLRGLTGGSSPVIASTVGAVVSTTTGYAFAPTLSLSSGTAGGTWLTSIRRASDNSAVSVTGSTTTTPTATLNAADAYSGDSFTWTASYEDPNGLTDEISGVVYVAGLGESPVAASTLAAVVTTTSGYSFAPTLSVASGKAGGTWSTAIKRASDNSAVSVTGSTTTTPTATLTVAAGLPGDSFIATSTYTDPDLLTDDVTSLFYVAGTGGVVWTTQDLSTFTLSDPQTMISSSSLGTSSSVTVKASIQGAMDAGRDGIWLAKSLAASPTWANYTHLLVRISGTFPTPTGNNIELRTGLVSSTDIATATGPLAGLLMDTGGARYVARSDIGSALGQDVAVNMGAITSWIVSIPIGSTGPMGVVFSGKGATNSRVSLLSTASTPTDAILAVTLETVGAMTGTAAFTGLVVETAWVNAA